MKLCLHKTKKKSCIEKCVEREGTVQDWLIRTIGILIRIREE